jgi:hypothetical protein
VLRALGPHGLYTATLFDYDADFVFRLGPHWSGAGPSCVASTSAARPVCRCCGRASRDSRPCAAVRACSGRSASRRPTDAPRALITASLRVHYPHPELAGRVRARIPFDVGSHALQEQSCLLELSQRAWASWSPTARACRCWSASTSSWGGRFLAFHVDPLFANTIDALVVVDLLRTRPGRLGYYLGRESRTGAASAAVRVPAIA